jgi:MYXO-CTERM domain-containing protein
VVALSAGASGSIHTPARASIAIQESGVNAGRTNGSLAFTGFNLGGALPIGFALIALGGLLLLRRRRTTQC